LSLRGRLRAAATIRGLLAAAHEHLRAVSAGADC
jgi:hypothetical protein